MTTLNGNRTILTTLRPDIFQISLQDEDGQNILSIDDGALRQSLRIEIVNTSGKNIEFQPIGEQLSLDNYHFIISFRPGTLRLSQDEDKTITLKEKDEGWQMQQQDNSFYLLLNSSETRVIENGEKITLTLENIGAAPQGGSRGTRVEIKYNQLQYQESNETISGNRLQYLNIVNQRGKKQIPLYVGFLGSNTILNDGTENELTLTIQSLPNQNSSLTFLESPEIAIIDTTRWQGDLVKFIHEKIPNFQSEIEKIAQNPNISDATKQFFVLLKESVKSNDSFEDFQTKLTDLTLDASHKETIFKILIDNLGVIIEEDFNAILTRLKSLLYPEDITQQELDRIKGIILQIIQESENFKVIKSELNSNGFLGFKGLDEEGLLDRAAKLTISFDVTTTDDDFNQWALVEQTNADDIQIDIVRGQENWIFGGKEEQGITPRWSFICKQGLQLQDRTEILRFSISNLKTQLLSGYANLYVHYENIPGYWDGYITVPIHKGPLLYRENSAGIGCVGIGTDKPQAKLHVKSSTGVDGLKVEGNTAIAGNVGIGIRYPINHKLEVNGSTAIAGTLTAKKIEGNGAFTTGMIIMWFGNVNQLSVGWALCDGKNGRPDLSGRFIVGYKQGDADYGQPGKTGGTERVTLSSREMPSHGHSGSTNINGNHQHWIEGSGADGLDWRKRRYSGTTTVDLYWGGGRNSDQDKKEWRGGVNTNTTGDHTHTVTIKSTGGGQAHENRPPYYVLAYIIKI